MAWSWSSSWSRFWRRTSPSCSSGNALLTGATSRCSSAVPLAARVRLDGGRGRGYRLGGEPPQAPRASRQTRRPAQPCGRPVPRAPGLAVRYHPRRPRGLLPPPAQGPGGPLRGSHLRPVGRPEPAGTVRAGRLDGPAVGRPNAHVLRPLLGAAYRQAVVPPPPPPRWTLPRTLPRLRRRSLGQSVSTPLSPEAQSGR